jgi:hypothetical protein
MLPYIFLVAIPFVLGAPFDVPSQLCDVTKQYFDSTQFACVNCDATKVRGIE